jgi:hypothetical protein
VSLSDWSQNGWLLPHRTSSQEIADLFAVVERDLADSAAENLSADWTLSIAYNAALQAAAAALAAEGYRAARDQHHYRVIQSLRFTIGAPPTLVGRFDAFRKKRNIGGYERAGLISDGEAQEMRDLARNLREAVREWLKSKHPALLPRGGKPPPNR